MKTVPTAVTAAAVGLVMLIPVGLISQRTSSQLDTMQTRLDHLRHAHKTAPAAQVRTIVKWRVRRRTEMVDNPQLVKCANELWQDWANRAPVAADMANVEPTYAPACEGFIGIGAP